MTYKLKYSSISEKGLRDNNEDLVVAQPLNEAQTLLVCIDGVGGENGGETAAAIAATSIVSLLEGSKKNGPDDLKMAVVTANNNIIEMQTNPRIAHMCCVLTACLIDVETGVMHICHVGDTRLYTMKTDSESLSQQTKDDSYVQRLYDQGLISETEARKHPKRNRINKCLGAKPLDYFSDYLSAFSVSIAGIKYVLLCSDGLYDVVSSQEIEMAVAGSESPETVSKKLVDTALRNGSRDNISVIMVEISNG